MDQSKKNTRKLNIGNIMLNYIDLKITFLLYKSFKLLHLKIHVFDMVDLLEGYRLHDFVRVQTCCT